MKYLLIIFLLISCGNGKAPKALPFNKASKSEQVTLNKVLENIQKDFDSLAIKVDLKKIRYSVNSLGGKHVGICYRRKNGQGIGIAIDHTVFLSEVESENYYGRIYNILLHEIGHCFFNRNHEETYLDLQGQQMTLTVDAATNSRYVYQQFVKSIMIPYEAFVLMPKVLWPYYIKEIAGIERVEHVDDLKKYTDLALSPLPQAVNLLQQQEHHH